MKSLIVSNDYCLNKSYQIDSTRSQKATIQNRAKMLRQKIEH